MLSRIETLGNSRAAHLQTPIGIIMERIELFHNLVNLAAVDGKFTDEEVQFLAERAEAWDIDLDEFETALAGVSEGGIQIQVPEEHEEKIHLMKEMVRLMAVDGDMDEAEKRMCALASCKMGFSAEQFDEIIMQVIAEKN